MKSIFVIVCLGLASSIMIGTENSPAAKPSTAGSQKHSPIGLTIQTANVDLIELNHFVDKDGREVFQQTVFYDWSKVDQRFHVRAWRLVKRDSQLPQRKWQPNHFVCNWQDKQVRRVVSAPQMRETWTQQDPERVNRQFLSEDQRRPLFEK